MDERLAMNAVAAATIWLRTSYTTGRATTRPRSITRVPRAEDQYRARLAKQECADFALVRDVAEAHKHVELNRKPRRLTASDQVMVRDQEFCLGLSMLDVAHLGALSGRR